jgi:hypothetical protein
VGAIARWNGRDVDEIITLSPARLSLDPSNKKLTKEQHADLKANIELLRDVLVLFTATGSARGVSGHTGELSPIQHSARPYLIFSITGGAFDTIPEVCILLALFEHSDKFLNTVFDEAGEHSTVQRYDTGV